MHTLDETRLTFSLAAFLVLALTLTACGSEEASLDAGITDASLVDAVVECTTNIECNDGLYCNGDESCSDTGQCEAGILIVCNDGIPCTLDSCSNGTRQCEFVAPDIDGDGHGDSSCEDDNGVPLGDDCDDLDDNRFPGNVEFCDADDHDEDCDSQTFGIVDVDLDGFASASCCNMDDSGEAICGNDCDDNRNNIHIGVTEACDGLDNDCNGMVDEGVLIAGFFDGDGDGYGDDSQPLQLCAGQAEFAVQGGDCDDDVPSINPGQVEFCDGLDNDCNTLVDDNTQTVSWYMDSDGDLFGDPNVAVILSCVPISGRSVLDTDCDDDAAAINPSSQELCDGLDNDCNGLADFQIGVNDFEDDDGDGLVDIQCSPLGTDCDDTNPITGPGTLEQCDGQDNDCDGNVDENVALTLWYRDLDSDGFGSIASGTLVSCEQPLGYSADGSDCDDGQPLVNTDGEEICNASDDDCDGTNNEEPAASSSCPPAMGATPVCVLEECSFTCNPGQSDCDGINNDCEVATNSDPNNCGGCGNTCNALDSNLSGTCALGVCECAPGFSDCDGDPSNGCETNLMNDDNNCNQCGTACNFLNALDQCNNGVCEVSLCLPGFDDCDATPGCETNVTSDTQCGACGNDCTNIPNTTASCQLDGGGGGGDARCAVSACNGSFMDCTNDGIVDDGCETDTLTDTQHCGDCFRPCDTGGNSTGDCVAGQCECSPGFESCNGIPCDTNTQNSINACGDCSTDCTTLITQVGAICNAGQCEALCNSNFGNCDINPLDCETDFSSVDNCGACGNACTAINGVPSCFQDVGLTFRCEAQCNLGFQSCDSDPENCETYTDNDPNNCGFCGNVCDRGATCNGGQCFGRIQSASVGEDFSCYLRDNGNAVCWGANDEGQLGNGATLPGTNTFMPELAATNTGDIYELTSGGQHSCVVAVLGTFCWGKNSSGQLGITNGLTSTSVPQAVQGPQSFKGISAGTDHTCAIATFTDTVYCWGNNSRGQLGQGVSGAENDTPTEVSPVSIPGLVASVVAGNQFTCATTMTQDVYCWGRGTEGQLGINVLADNSTPSLISGYFPQSLSLGGTSACGIRNTGSPILDCWGDDSLLQLGNGSPVLNEAVPTPTTLGSALQVSVGLSHACMLTQAPFESVYCWGDNSFGQSGQGNTTGQTAQAVEVTSLSSPTGSIAHGPGANHVCVVDKTFEPKLHCWGDNGSGQIGVDPATNPTVSLPSTVQ